MAAHAGEPDSGKGKELIQRSISPITTSRLPTIAGMSLPTTAKVCVALMAGNPLSVTTTVTRLVELPGPGMVHYCSLVIRYSDRGWMLRSSAPPQMKRSSRLRT